MTPLLEVRDLSLSVQTDAGTARILDHVDFAIESGEIFGVVGESGCGKSTLIRAVLGLPPKDAVIDSGRILFRGEDLLGMSAARAARRIRGRAIGFIPQDPYQSFNPTFTVGKQMLEILRWSGLPEDPEGTRWTRATRARHRARLIEVLHAVQIADPEEALTRYPHQFSGGQRQRILIAGALAARPALLLADEPTTALDVTTQMQILKLLRDLAAEFDVSLMFVTHDFGAVAQLCDRVSVMYAGQTVETGTASQIINAPRHPYTERLIGCHPDRSGALTGIAGQVSSPIDPPAGCRFHPRCELAEACCSASRPPLQGVKGAHRVACVVRSPHAAPRPIGAAP
ncbi:MAG: ABC transporter ATP-binding protein [Jannaschia sp.]